MTKRPHDYMTTRLNDYKTKRPHDQMTKLRECLTLFEQAEGALTVAEMARRLAVSPAQVEGMLEHWVRKGRLRPSTQLTNCGSCGHQNGCPYVLEMPRSYELATEQPLADGRRLSIPCRPSPPACCP